MSYSSFHYYRWSITKAALASNNSSSTAEIERKLVSLHMQDMRKWVLCEGWKQPTRNAKGRIYQGLCQHCVLVGLCSLPPSVLVWSCSHQVMGSSFVSIHTSCMASVSRSSMYPPSKANCSVWAPSKLQKNLKYWVLEESLVLVILVHLMASELARNCCIASFWERRQS